MQSAFSHCNVLISRLLNILYPSKCPSCGDSSDHLKHAPICTSCWTRMEKYSGPSCRICALPLESEYAGVCGQCLKKPPTFSKVITYGLYKDVLAEAVHQFKFHGLKRLAQPLGSLLVSLDLPSADGLVPVPLTSRGLRERGFNQSLLIARVLSKKTKIPLFMDVLLKKRETIPQIGLSAKERINNLKNAFEVKGDISSLRLLLVDDVMTTGATVTECSKVLMKAGAEEVTVLALARAPLL